MNGSGTHTSNRPPVQLLVIIATAVFVAEMLVMWLMQWLALDSPLMKTLLDAALLTIVVFPVLYLFVFRPTTRQIAEREQAEGAVQAKKEEVERFTYTVSHDLRSPLVTVQTFLGHLEQDIHAQNAARVADDLNFIRTAANQMARLLDDLLKLSRLGRLANPPADVLLQAVAKDALDLVSGRIVQRGVQVTVAKDPVTLHGDRAHFVSLFQNLVDNACKFMGDQMEPSIGIGVETRATETVFFVRDNGGGIDPRHQSKVFGLFEKLDPNAEGTGLGLALVKRTVELYGGKIWMESKGIGQGACFYFTLPGAVGRGEEVRIQNSGQKGE